MDTTYLDKWITRKRARQFLSIRETRCSRFKYAHQFGPRGHFAVILLRGEPANAFAFESLATWPDPRDDYTTAVLDGILDELFASGVGHVVANVHFVLEAIEFHPVDSCDAAYYLAARGSV